MRITLITVGKIKEKFYQDAISEYAKRLSRYCKLDVIQDNEYWSLSTVWGIGYKFEVKR